MLKEREKTWTHVYEIKTIKGKRKEDFEKVEKITITTFIVWLRILANKIILLRRLIINALKEGALQRDMDGR